MKLHLLILIIFTFSVLFNTYWLEFIYNPSTDDAFIDDAFPWDAKRYEEAIAKGEQVELVEYTWDIKRVVKIRSIWPVLEKEQPVVENKAPQEVKKQDDKIYTWDIKTAEILELPTETSPLSYDIDKLADCVSLAETWRCTKGMWKTRNNCFGIMHRPNGKRQGRNYATKEDSFTHFKQIRQKSYKHYPNLKLATKWTGNDNAQRRLNTVNACYYN